MHIETFAEAPKGPQWQYLEPKGEPQAIAGKWTVSFIKGGPELPAEAKVEQLGSWTKFAGDTGKAFSGTAKYSIMLANHKRLCRCIELIWGTSLTVAGSRSTAKSWAR